MGLYQGRSESGPRALGNRTILADPRNPNVQSFINQRVKGREWFRPLAPTVTAALRLVNVTLTLPGADTLNACDVPPFIVSTLEKVSVVGPVVGGVVVVGVDGDVGLLEHPAAKDANTRTPKSAALILTI